MFFFHLFLYVSVNCTGLLCFSIHTRLNQVWYFIKCIRLSAAVPSPIEQLRVILKTNISITQTLRNLVWCLFPVTSYAKWIQVEFTCLSVGVISRLPNSLNSCPQRPRLDAKLQQRNWEDSVKEAHCRSHWHVNIYPNVNLIKLQTQSAFSWKDR